VSDEWTPRDDLGAVGGMRVIPLTAAIDRTARILLAECCPFEDARHNFDGCSSGTREVYEEMAARAFGLTIAEYYDLPRSADCFPSDA
jgi:hypothetical protein